MGKKKKEELDKLRVSFMEGGKEKGHPDAMLEKIWKDWEAFAKYAFNKSHATCYAWVSYQTAYLKAHYPSEFQASNLTQNSSNMDELKEIMADCRKGGIKVTNPDVNESQAQFSVNKEGVIRFGLGGIKGFGGNIVEAIIKERESGGAFADPFDFMERMSGVVNRKALESLIYAGALDSFGYCRTQYFLPGKSGDLFIDELVHYSELYRNDQVDAATSLFGEVEEMKPVRPEFPDAPKEEDSLALLQQEKELVGMYISSHPLDKYAFEMQTYTDVKLSGLQEVIDECQASKKGCKVHFAGIITDTKDLLTKANRKGKRITLEDDSGVYEVALFGKEYEQFIGFLNLHEAVFIEAEIKEQRYREGQFGLNITGVSFLGNLNESRIASLTVSINTKLLNPEFRQRLVKLFKKYKGDIPLKVNCFDERTGYLLRMYSKTINVNVCEPFINEVQRLGMTYEAELK